QTGKDAPSAEGVSCCDVPKRVIPTQRDDPPGRILSSTKSDSVETLTGGDGEPEPALPKITQGSSDSWDGRAHPGDQGDPLVGTTLHETYTVVRIIGEGGMGRVYEARH